METSKNKAVNFKFDRKYEKVETTVIYESMEWDQFILSYRNRYNRANLEKSVAFSRLLKSIKEYGQLSPGLVSSDGVIISGQTRFTACRTLGIPFKYTISEKDSDELMMDMLTDGTTVYRWSIVDIINFYAECKEGGRGNSFYHLLELHEKTGVPIRDISNLNMAIGGGHLNDYDSVIRGIMPRFNKAKLSKFLELLVKVSNKNPFSSSKRIWVGVIHKLYQEFNGDYTAIKDAIDLFLKDICDDKLTSFIAEKDLIGALNNTADRHNFGFCIEASVAKR